MGLWDWNYWPLIQRCAVPGAQLLEQVACFPLKRSTGTANITSTKGFYLVQVSIPCVPARIFLTAASALKSQRGTTTMGVIHKQGITNLRAFRTLSHCMKVLTVIHQRSRSTISRKLPRKLRSSTCASVFLSTCASVFLTTPASTCADGCH